MFETQFMNASINGWMTAMPAEALLSCDDAIAGEALAPSDGSESGTCVAADFSVSSDAFTAKEHRVETAISVPDQPVHGAPVTEPLGAWLIIPPFFEFVRILAKAAWDGLWHRKPAERIPADRPVDDLLSSQPPPIVREARLRWFDIADAPFIPPQVIIRFDTKDEDPAQIVEAMLGLAQRHDRSVPEKFRGVPMVFIQGGRDFDPESYLTVQESRSLTASWEIDQILREARQRPVIVAITGADLIKPTGPTARLHKKMEELHARLRHDANILLITTEMETTPPKGGSAA